MNPRKYLEYSKKEITYILLEACTYFGIDAVTIETVHPIVPSSLSWTSHMPAGSVFAEGKLNHWPTIWEVGRYMEKAGFGRTGCGNGNQMQLCYVKLIPGAYQYIKPPWNKIA